MEGFRRVVGDGGVTGSGPSLQQALDGLGDVAVAVDSRRLEPIFFRLQFADELCELAACRFALLGQGSG